MARLIQSYCLLLFLLSGNLCYAEGLSRADYFIEAYGRVNAEDNETVAEAHSIFDTLAWIAQNQISNVPRLVVVDSNDKPWAIALPDNSIILSIGAIRICQSLSVLVKTRACLAFVLGHELAHLSNRDFWHRDTYQSLMSNGDMNKAYSDREVEFKADEIGFLYASLAGYPVERVFSEEDNLFALWATRTQENDQQANVKLRSKLIRKRTDELAAKSVMARYALVLSLFERFEDAIPLYKELIDVFPAKEFLNNIGYSYLRMAMRSMLSTDGQGFIFPALLETETLPGQYSKVFAPRSASAYIHQLGSAVTYFERALDVNKQYVPAIYNLAISRFFLGEYHDARASIEKAIELEPDNHSFKMVRSIIIFQQETDVDMWPLTITRLESLAKKYPDDYLLKYNIALMYQLRYRDAEAKSNYLEIAGDSPDAKLRTVACEKLPRATAECAGPVENIDSSIKSPMLPGKLMTNPSAEWELNSSVYTLYSSKGESWLYINGKPELYSLNTLNPLFRKFEYQCAAAKNIEVIFGSNVFNCGRNRLSLGFGKASPDMWVNLSG